MEDLHNTLKQLLSNTFITYFKAHSYHWNVTGKQFSSYHDYFGELYSEIYSSIDPMAEQFRILGVYAPMSLTELYMYKSAVEDVVVPNTKDMFTRLLQCNVLVIDNLNTVYKLAEKYDEQGLVDFIAGRIDAHKKHSWMLKSFLTGE